MTDQQFAQIMNIFDLDGSNEIEFEEFIKVLANADLVNQSFRALKGREMHDWSSKLIKYFPTIFVFIRIYCYFIVAYI